MNKIVIRLINKEDNKKMASIIRAVLEEFKMAIAGTAYEDESTNKMSDFYSDKKYCYFVAEIGNNILGGGGIAPLANYNKEVCELQKMYFSKEARGKGIGELLLNKCLETAKDLGFKQCYLETDSNMKKAQKLYVKKGFQYLKTSLGNTGHHACGVWMIKDL